jgi:hypothetical protein
LLEKRTFAERQYFLIAQSASQLKANVSSTLLAAGEDFSGFERGLMHKTVRIVVDAINATLEHTLPGYKLVQFTPPTTQPQHRTSRSCESDAGTHILSCSMMTMFSPITYVISPNVFAVFGRKSG